MPRKTHSEIVSFHKKIADFHKEINGFYRFDMNEIIGQFRSGVGMPALLLESHSANLLSQTNMTTNFNNRSISLLLLDFGGAQGDYDKQNEVLDRLENIVLDISSYLVKQNKTRDTWLYGMFDINSFKYEKVGPIFDNMYGWNILYSLKAQESMEFNPDKWDIIE